jgi:hypothetical protein
MPGWRPFNMLMFVFISTKINKIVYNLSLSNQENKYEFQIIAIDNQHSAISALLGLQGEKSLLKWPIIVS